MQQAAIQPSRCLINTQLFGRHRTTEKTVPTRSISKKQTQHKQESACSVKYIKQKMKEKITSTNKKHSFGDSLILGLV